MPRLFGALLFGLVLFAQPAKAGGGGDPQACVNKIPTAGQVDVLNSCFLPGSLQTETGKTIKWIPVTPGAHTVTFTDGPDSGPLRTPFAVRFNRPGTYRYSCVYHKGMDGSVEVVGKAFKGEALAVTAGGPTEAASSAPLPVRKGIHPLAGAALFFAGIVLPRAARLGRFLARRASVG